ncbi:hypothetical protein C8R43DRAFT_844164, partial [Mycena crocata]
MRKMVNAMSAKMEIGSPMASMYVLGHPDHYTSHSYVPFAWRAYVQFVRIDDYRYRPVIYNNVSLYEWIQCYERKIRTKQERADFDYDLLMAKYLATDGYEAAKVKLVKDEQDDHDSRLLQNSYDDEVVVSRHVEAEKNRKPARHPFTTDHPLFLSHSVSCDFNRIHTVIPNFIGGAVPRSDKGDRVLYCLSMLTLFKPWRSPGDLKDTNLTWDQAFRQYDFTKRQLELLANFNTRYECNDARDDHFAALKKKIASVKSVFPSHFTFEGEGDDFVNDLRAMDYDSSESGDEHDDDDLPKGPRTRKMEAEAAEIRNIATESGWLNRCIGNLPEVDID